MDPNFWRLHLEKARGTLPPGRSILELALEVARIVEHAVRLTTDPHDGVDLLQARINQAKTAYGFSQDWIDRWISWYRLLYFRTDQHGQDLLDWLHRDPPSGPDGAALRAA